VRVKASRAASHLPAAAAGSNSKQQQEATASNSSSSSSHWKQQQQHQEAQWTDALGSVNLFCCLHLPHHTSLDAPTRKSPSPPSPPCPSYLLH
jgi:hypothetical protein